MVGGRDELVDLRPRRHHGVGVLLGQHRTAQEGEGRLARRPGRPVLALGQRRGRPGHAGVQLLEVDPRVPQGVAAVGTSDPLGAQRPSQPRDQDAHLLGRVGREVGVPQRVRQRVDRHRGAAGDGQQLQDGPALAAAQRALVDPVHDERSEDPYPWGHGSIGPRRRHHLPILPTGAIGHGPSDSETRTLRCHTLT